MTVMQPEVEDSLEDLEDFSIPCDGPRVWPERIRPHDYPAVWIGLKSCGHHRLLCDVCKEFYLNRQAVAVAFICGECGQRVAGEAKFLGFERLGRS